MDPRTQFALRLLSGIKASIQKANQKFQIVSILMVSFNGGRFFWFQTLVSWLATFSCLMVDLVMSALVVADEYGLTVAQSYWITWRRLQGNVNLMQELARIGRISLPSMVNSMCEYRLCEPKTVEGTPVLSTIEVPRLDMEALAFVALNFVPWIRVKLLASALLALQSYRPLA